MDEMSGLSIIEVIIVVALLGIIGSFAVVYGVRDQIRSLRTSDRMALVSLLQHARAESVLGICEGSCSNGPYHGVRVTSTTFTLFQGPSFLQRDVAYDSVFERSSLGTDTVIDVVFTPYTATSTDAGITIADDEYGSTTVLVSHIGQIIWSR